MHLGQQVTFFTILLLQALLFFREMKKKAPVWIHATKPAAGVKYV